MCLSVCGYVHLSAGAHVGQKGAPDSPRAGGIGSWQLPKPAREQSVFCTAEPSLQTLLSYMVLLF